MFTQNLLLHCCTMIDDTPDIHLYFMVATRVVAATAARTLRTGLWTVRRLLRRHRRLLEASRRSPVVRDIVTATQLLSSVTVFTMTLNSLLSTYTFLSYPLQNPNFVKCNGLYKRDT